jgi:hypothetical protein
MGKGAHRGQSCIAAAHRVVAFGFEVGEEVEDQRRIEVAQSQLGRWFAPFSVRIAQQQPEGIAIGGDRPWAGILLLQQAFGEEALDQRGEFGRNGEQGVHRVAP